MEWRGLEIHPETPSEGVPLTARFRPQDIERMMAHLRAMGAPLGIPFVDRTLLSTSRPALQAAEYAREAGMFDAFHVALFSAYFSQGLDIGNRDVLLRIGAEAELNPDGLAEALESGRYLPKLRETQEEATRLGVTGVPTFFLGEKKRIVGAQPLDVFRAALRSR